MIQKRSMLRKLMLLRSSSGGGSLTEYTETGNPVSFSTDVAKALTSFTIPFTPVQASGTPSPENVLPISGITGLTAYRTGKNLLNPAWWDDVSANMSYVQYEDGQLHRQSNSYKASGYVSIIGNTEYTLHAGMNSQNAAGMAFYNASKQYISGIQMKGATKTDYTFTTPTNAEYMRFSTLRDIVPFDEVMLVFGSTAPTAYAPYSGTSYPVTFPAEAGTVYGGELDLVTGVLTVTEKGVHYDGSNDEQWEYHAVSTGNLFRIKQSDRKLEMMNGQPQYYFCDSYVLATNTTTDRTNGKFSGINTDVDFINDSYDNLTSWREHLSEDPIQFVYRLGTPLTYQLSDLTVPVTLIGDNVIWTDTNGINEIKYLKKG